MMLDFDKFNEIKVLMNDQFDILLEVYQSDTLSRYSDMLRSLDSQDFTTIGRLAHAMKSSSANIGAAGVASLAERLEHAARQGLISEIPPLMPELEKAIEETIQILNNEQKHVVESKI